MPGFEGVSAASLQGQPCLARDRLKAKNCILHRGMDTSLGVKEAWESRVGQGNGGQSCQGGTEVTQVLIHISLVTGHAENQGRVFQPSSLCHEISAHFLLG